MTTVLPKLKPDGFGWLNLNKPDGRKHKSNAEGCRISTKRHKQTHRGMQNKSKETQNWYRDTIQQQRDTNIVRRKSRLFFNLAIFLVARITSLQKAVGTYRLYGKKHFGLKWYLTCIRKIMKGKVERGWEPLSESWKCFLLVFLYCFFLLFCLSTSPLFFSFTPDQGGNRGRKVKYRSN